MRRTSQARMAGLGVALALGSAGGAAQVTAIAACSRAAPPGEDVSSSTLPPITVCFEPDGSPCPPPDGGDGGGDDGASDNGGEGDASASN